MNETEQIEKVETLWRRDDVAKMLSVSLLTVDRMIASGDIPSIKIGFARRFIPERVKEWMAKGCPKAKRKGARRVTRA